VLPPAAVNETVPHAVDVPEMEAVGTLFTVITCDVVAVQPAADVTVTVYVPDEVKVLAAVKVLFPPLHEYELPPDAVNETEPQPEVLPLKLMLGSWLTVTVWLVVTEQPLASVPVTE
jgi:hypothetical protein